jgi:hypothetical protein
MLTNRRTLQIPCFKGNQFGWRGRLGVCEASDLRPAHGFSFFYARVWPDAADVGFMVQGKNELKLFTLESEETDPEGEITSWYFRSEDGIRIHIFND